MSINSKFFSLDYLEDFSRRLEQIAMWQRLKFYRDDAGSVTVPAASSVEWLSISGPGKAIRGKHESKNIGAGAAMQEAQIDGETWSSGWGVTATVHACHASGATSRGYYSCGESGLIITDWDTTNNYYLCWGTFSNLQWLESLVLRFKNTNSTTDATMKGQFVYYLPTASKSFKLEMVAPKMPKIENLNEIRNEFKLHHIVMALSKQGKGKGAKNQYKLTINAPDSFRDKNLYKVVEKIQKATT